VISLLAFRITMLANMTNPNACVTQHVLHRRAVDLGRKLYASLPWGYRVARFFEVLAADSLDAFGRVVTAQMILAVVRGIPDIGSRPASDWIQDVNRRGPDVLPAGTGRAFASRVYKILLSKFTDPEVAEEAMSKVMLQAARGKLHLHNGSEVHDAESYIITIALNAARDLLRAQGRRREDSLVRERDDQQTTIDVEDPEAFARLDKLLPASELRVVLRDLGEVHPRAPEWLQARLQGDSGQEIATDWGTTPSYVSKWQRQYVPAIRRVVEHHLRQARTRYSYDRRAAP
jgi:DNA-directed RNA polymerase specialized sigma24 family protein